MGRRLTYLNLPTRIPRLSVRSEVFEFDGWASLGKVFAGVSLPFTEGTVVRFPKHECDTCPLRSQCTQSKHGRSISIHPDESLLAELRERQTTESGRAKLRERVSVEHTLAHIGQWQGDKARYIGLRKNRVDLRRMAVVHNLHVLARMSQITTG
jgi:hypothetical protein